MPHHHTSHHTHHHHSTFSTIYYEERVIAIPCKTNIPHLFSIAKRPSKYGRTFERLLSSMQQQNIVQTNNPDFDDTYTLLLANDTANQGQCIEFALRILPILNQHLSTLKKIPVGQTSYLCILSFSNDTCFIRFHPQIPDLTALYNLATELMSFS